MASSKHYPKGYGEGAGTVNSDQSKLSTSFDDDNWSEEGDRDSGRRSQAYGGLLTKRVVRLTDGFGTDHHLSVSVDMWEAAQQLIREFQNHLGATEKISEMKLVMELMRFVLDYKTFDQALFVSLLPMLRSIFLHFNEYFLDGNSIHAITEGIDADDQKSFIRTYYRTSYHLHKERMFINNVYPVKSALLEYARQKQVRLFGVFGGQGYDDYFDELREVYELYKDVHGFMRAMALVLRAQASSNQALTAGHHPDGMDVMRWLRSPETTPSKSYLTSAAVSMPLIGLTQLCNYAVLLHVLDLSCNDVVRLLEGVTGHSQGVVVAAAVAASEDKETLLRNGSCALSLLFWLGTRMQETFPPHSCTVSPMVERDSLAHGEGVPTPMLSVRGLEVEVVKKFIKATNEHLSQTRSLEVALINGHRSVVVAGDPSSLHGLCTALRKIRGDVADSQARVPHSQRKQVFTYTYLPVGVPFHSSYLERVPAIVKGDIERLRLAWSGTCRCRVNATDTGKDLRRNGDVDMLDLVRLICTTAVDWMKSTSQPSGVTHFIDFGPGRSSGVGYMTYRNKEGTGVQVVLCPSLRTNRQHIMASPALFNSSSSAVKWGLDWGKCFGPNLVRVRGRDNELMIDTRFSRLLGKPPLMVAGMTPCTVAGKINIATIKAGYHIELAGGGHHSEKMMKDKIDEIVAAIPAGEGITVNILFLNARQWGFQFPLVCKLRNQGYPIDGVCVAAGVPSPDVASDIMKTMQDVGMRHISFKPGSKESILAVCAIAAAMPNMPVILQWTGGRAGGHHSFEDMHQPIIATYAQIREHDNIILVAGSGMGSASTAYPYLTGEWALRYGSARMPFDGILFGSRMMVALEAATSSSVKEYLCYKTEGIGEEEEHLWESTYDGVLGGVTTVVSELNEPIHMVATRGVLLWKELDTRIFALPAEKRLPALLEMKPQLIHRLNADFQRVYFGRKGDDTVCDLDEMTYAEVARRCVKLMYISSEKRWIHRSYATFVYDFLERVEERLAETTNAIGTDIASVLPDEEKFSQSPHDLMEDVLSAYPASEEQIINTNDVAFFLLLCRRRGQKPPPFIPTIDADFKTYFKKDSLWQSEDINAVVDQDVGRVCILQGPVAARYSTKPDQPIKNILDDINAELIKRISEEYLSSTSYPATEYIGGDVASTHDLTLVQQRVSTVSRRLRSFSVANSVTSIDSGHVGRPVTPSANARVARGVVEEISKQSMDAHGKMVCARTIIVSQLEKDMPSRDEFMAFLAGDEKNWLYALLTLSTVVQGKMQSHNPIRDLLTPRAGMRVVISYAKDASAKSTQGLGRPTMLEVVDLDMNRRVSGNARADIEITAVVILIDDQKHITVSLREPNALEDGVPHNLFLHFEYRPDQGQSSIHEIMEGRIDAVKQFYQSLWEIDSVESLPADLESLMQFEFTADYRVDRSDLRQFLLALGRQLPEYADSCEPEPVPMDFAIVIAWRAIVSAIFPKPIDADVLFLVHKSNEFRWLEGPDRVPLRVGESVVTRVRVTALVNEAGGKLVEVGATLARHGDLVEKPVMEITTQFLFRGEYYDFINSYRSGEEISFLLPLPDDKSVAVVRDKKWIKWDLQAEELVKAGASLVFKLRTVARFLNKEFFSSIATTGVITTEKVTGEIVEVGVVDFTSDGPAKSNIVMDYLRRRGRPIEEMTQLENKDGEELSYVINAPHNNEAYARASTDYNPIHVNPFIAALCGLPDTIVHGMWTSAQTRLLVEQHAAGGDSSRMRSFKAEFVGMVRGGDALTCTVTHVGMRRGRKVLQAAMRNQRGETVLLGTSEVDQPTTAVVFTGQGSQSKGMGMDLYQSSEVARNIWDRADAHFKSSYGFSIVDIVKYNPKKFTVHFGGVAGAAIRKNYMSMTYNMHDPSDGSVKSYSLFPNINEMSTTHTFFHPEGLLSATQFTQPALVLFEKAAFEDMKEHGLIPQDCLYCGHSLGEYAALASIGDVLPIEALVDVVFYRGMTMQGAVPRNEKGESDYAMMAVNPLRVSPAMSERLLKLLNERILQAYDNKGLLEVINYNVDKWQYVVAGNLEQLDTLTESLNIIGTLAKKKRIDFSKVEDSPEVARIIQTAVSATAAKKLRTPRIALQRGLASIPLPGIDVPFHSRFLLSGVEPFRNQLYKFIHRRNINIRKLKGKYLPNLLGDEFFDISHDYVKRVYEMTDSPVLEKVLAEWIDADGNEQYHRSGEDKQQLGYILVVELLSYQFASPVQWIKSQDVLFQTHGVERLVEIGPQPILVGMAKRTLALKYQAQDDANTRKRDLLCFGTDKAVLYFNDDDGMPAAPTPTAPKSSPPQTIAPTPSATSLPPTAGPLPSAGASIPDVSLSNSEIIAALVAQKLNKQVDTLDVSKSIKGLSGGKSTMVNELLGDISKEFGLESGDVGEGGEDKSLTELAKSLTNKSGPGLGKSTTRLVSRLFSSRMPAGFNASTARAYLSRKGFGEQRQDGVMLVGITMPPAERLKSEQEANAWWDSVVSVYAKAQGISLSSGAAASSLPVQAQAAPPVQAQAVSRDDSPLNPLEVVRTIVANKTKKSLTDVPSESSIQKLCGGKSTMVNEIAGDLSGEFAVSSLPDNSSELPLKDLAEQIGSNYSGRMGKVASRLVSRSIGSILPAGMSLTSVRTLLEEQVGFGEGRQDGALLHATTMVPSQRFSSDSEATQWWVSSVATSYAAQFGFSLGTGSGGSGSSMVNYVASGVSSAEMDQFQTKHNSMLAEQMAVLARHIGDDPRHGERLAEERSKLIQEMQIERDLWRAEMGDEWLEGIRPKFDARMVRVYDSYWNWVRQDLQQLRCEVLEGRLVNVDREVISISHHVMNRATRTVSDELRFHISYAEKHADMKTGDPDRQRNLADLARKLLTNVQLCLEENAPPFYREFAYPTQPKVELREDGSFHYEEVRSSKNRNMKNFVKEMKQSANCCTLSEQEKLAAAVLKQCEGSLSAEDLTRLKELLSSNASDYKPRLFLRPPGQSVAPNKELTSLYFDCLEEIAERGITFQGKTVLMTGCGRGSIGVALLSSLLAGGAQVMVTTSSFSKQTTEFYRGVYERFGGKGSRLVVCSFNQGSVTDIEHLVDFMYSKEKSGLGDLDLIVPFAAISERGEIGSLTPRNALAQRIMLTNLLLLLGEVRKRKEQMGIETRPATVLLPLSPNHGIMGGDGMYAESKIALEALLNKWQSEKWAKYLSIIGAKIGWTRGTALMQSQDVVAEQVEEKLGIRTFSQVEMAFALIGCLHERIINVAQLKHPVFADLSGGFESATNLNEEIGRMRSKMLDGIAVKRALREETVLEAEATGRDKGGRMQRRTFNRRANHLFPFPALSEDFNSQTKGYEHLYGMLDLDKVVVVCGFGEVGPWGSARTRWEMEATGVFSVEGCVEMAWLMGLIKYFEGKTGQGQLYSGWVDAKTNEPVRDIDVKGRYERYILEHSGIRVIEPDLFDGYDPQNKQFLVEVVIDGDVPEIEVSEEEAMNFKKRHGDSADVYCRDGDRWMVSLRRGATIYVPKAVAFNRWVAGQLPTGWNAATYGIPEDIINQVDPVTCYNLVSTMEALLSAGITDPYEFYQHMHVSEVANTTGSGVGGMRSTRRIYLDRTLDKEVPGDMLQEHFINTAAAWVNMLMMSASGPVKTPVGACATSVQSVDIAVETILSGKAKAVIAGGFDDFQEQGSYEFAQMGATSNTKEEVAAGREPKEMSRPTSSSRSGFMEAQGAGNQLLMSASTAIEMGLPIYGIIAHSATAMDKEGRSVPAPGQGILTTARQSPSQRCPHPILDMSYRRRMLRQALVFADKWHEQAIAEMQADMKEQAAATGGEQSTEHLSTVMMERMEYIDNEHSRQRKTALMHWGNDFYRGVHSKAISPLQGALATYGLTVDDIQVASFHGTSTKANDTNESSVLHQQMAHLGRSIGKPLFGVFQKYLTGHPKGAAAAWMLNGVLQIINSGIVPGNRNADNIDSELQQYHHIVFPSRTIKMPPGEVLKAALLKSFGFGQVGGEVLVLHPDHLLACLSPEEYAVYRDRRQQRYTRAYRYFHEAMSGQRSLVHIKSAAPYGSAIQSQVYLDPSARAEFTPKAKTWTFNEKRWAPKADDVNELERTAKHMAFSQATQGRETASTTSKTGVGVDIEPISSINIDNEDFVRRNFSAAEVEYCNKSADPKSSFAGRWCAKEAVIKALSSLVPEQKVTKDSGAGLSEVEILPGPSGAPLVKLHGEAKERVERAMHTAGIEKLQNTVSISHSGSYAMAMATSVGDRKE